MGGGTNMVTVYTVCNTNTLLPHPHHTRYSDRRRFPDFRSISPSGRYNEAIDAVIVSHFHLDHVAALPVFTQICGYKGPILMTHPTKAMCPIMLEDFRCASANATVYYSPPQSLTLSPLLCMSRAPRLSATPLCHTSSKVTVEKHGAQGFFTKEHIEATMKQVTPLQVRPQFTQCCSIMTSHTLEQHSCIKQCRCSMAGFKSPPTMLVTSWVLPCFISRLETTACCIQVHTVQHL